jgi:hypothetical protein
MPATDNDVLSYLPGLAWRKLPAPLYDLLEVSWENGLAPRHVAYVDGDVHDAVGRGSFPMTARLYFLNSLEFTPPGGGRVFPEYWRTWEAQLLDGDAGDLTHPLLGGIRARVKGGKFTVQASCRSGIVVDVTWLETVENPADLNVNGYGTITLPTAALATTADDALEVYAAGLAIPDPALVFAFQMPSALLNVQFGLNLNLSLGLGVSISITSVFLAILPALFAADSGSAVLLSALMGSVATMIGALEAHDDVFAYAAADAMIAFYVACDNLRRNTARTSRPTAQLVTVAPTTLDAVQRLPQVSPSNSMTDLMGLNLYLLVQPRITTGTAVTYYLAA